MKYFNNFYNYREIKYSHAVKKNMKYSIVSLIYTIVPKIR